MLRSSLCQVVLQQQVAREQYSQMTVALHEAWHSIDDDVSSVEIYAQEEVIIASR